MAQIDRKQAAAFLLAGAMVGATVALLCTPQSGAQTAKNIKDFAGKAVDRLDDLQSDIGQKVGHWVDDIAAVVKERVTPGKKAGMEG
jgi:gas vesicle protein